MPDFARLADRVLRTCMGTMAKGATQVIVTPVKSQPGAPAYGARGIWTVRNIDVQLEDSSIMSSVIYTLGIRLAEFTKPPAPEDQIAIDGVNYLVDDSDPDGQGGAVLTLKSLKDPRL